MGFDDIFDYIGGMGAYQINLFIILGLTSFYGGLQMMAMIFLGPYQDHWCEVEGLLSLPYDQQQHVGIPYNSDDETYERCLYYDMEYYNYTTEELCFWNETAEHTETLECDAWVYDTTAYAKTAVSEYNLVCDRVYFVLIVYSFQVLAVCIGVFVGGTLADYFGRRPVIVAGICSQLFFGILGTFAPSYWLFLFSRTLQAFTLTLGSGYILITEIVGPQYRVIVGSVYWIFWALGFMVLPCIAVFVTDFRYLQLILTCLTLPSLAYIWLVPESPRILVINGNYEKAEKILRYIAEVNRRQYPENAELIMTEKSEHDLGDKTTTGNEHAIGKYALFVKNPTIRKTFLLTIPAYIVSGIVYYGLSFNVGALSGNIYFNTFLSGLVEIPASLFALLFMYALGRRKTMFLSLSLAGLFCLLCVPFVANNSGTMVTTLSMIGKGFISIAFSTMYLYTAELFPTVIRGIAFGLTEIAASLGGMIAPFMGVPLIAIWEPLPLLIFGLLGTVTGPLMLVLPETNGRDLPDTVEEAEALWKKPASKHAVEPIKLTHIAEEPI